MKTDRSSSASIRAAAVLLVGLLFVAGLPAAGQIRIGIGGLQITVETPSKRLAKALAQEVKEVQRRFDENRRALRAVQGPGGKPAYLREEVIDLIDRTGKDLDQAMEQIGKADLDPLRAWAIEGLQGVQKELAPPSDRRAAALPAAVARIASLGSFPSPGPESVIAAVPNQETISAERANGLLDQAGVVLSRIFFLAERNDLRVKLWVGSTPTHQARFAFWSRGQIKGSEPERSFIRTDGKQEVTRGLYSYHASLATGSITEIIEYPNPAAQAESERLDLVNDTSFFCCRFKEQVCEHVANEKECH
jgi:hypothetical protein